MTLNYQIIQNLQLLSDRAHVFIPYTLVDATEADIEPLRAAGLILRSGDKIALTLSGLQHNESAHKVQSIWLTRQHQSIKQYLDRKYQSSGVSGQTEDHLNDWILGVLERNKLDGKEVHTNHLKRWASNATRDDIRTQSKNPVFRALYNGKTETDRKKGLEDQRGGFSLSTEKFEITDTSASPETLTTELDLYNQLRDVVTENHGVAGRVVFFTMVSCGGDVEMVVRTCKEHHGMRKADILGLIRKVRESVQTHYHQIAG